MSSGFEDEIVACAERPENKFKIRLRQILK